MYSEKEYLPELIRIWQTVERETGYRWKCTSYWRHSPSHSKGYALDIAPDISPDSERDYAVNQGSDPVLYKRVKLVRTLQKVARKFRPTKYDVGIYIEPDHLHLQLFAPEGKDHPLRVRLFKWKIVKPVYADSAIRSNLPLIV